jgi:hypothetical protein
LTLSIPKAYLIFLNTNLSAKAHPLGIDLLLICEFVPKGPIFFAQSAIFFFTPVVCDPSEMSLS